MKTGFLKVNIAAAGILDPRYTPYSLIHAHIGREPHSVLRPVARRGTSESQVFEHRRYLFALNFEGIDQVVPAGFEVINIPKSHGSCMHVMNMWKLIS